MLADFNISDEVEAERDLPIWAPKLAALRRAVQSHEKRISSEQAQAGKLTEQLERLTSELRRVQGALSEGKAEEPDEEGPEALAKLLAALIPFVHEDRCPVCRRDYSEVDDSGLAPSIVQQIEDLGNRAEELHRQQAQTRALGARLRELQRLILSTRQELGHLSAAAVRRSHAALLRDARNELEGIEEYAGSHDVLARTIRALRLKVKENEHRAFRWTEVRTRLGEYAVQIQGEKPGSGLDMSDLIEAALSLRDQSRNEILSLTEILEGTIRDEQAIGRLESTLDYIQELQARVDRCQKQIEPAEGSRRRVAASLRAAERLMTASREIRNRAKAIQENQVDQVIERGLNEIWKEIFLRLVINERFYPQLERLTSRAGQPVNVRFVVGPARDFRQPAAVLSSGNLNTAALSLFLALYLMEPPKVPLLVLDDPVQSMDDLRLTELAALLRNLGREREHQLIVAIHDRSLFDYLKVELGPTQRGKSLLTLEIVRAAHGPPRVQIERATWKDDPVSFGEPKAL